MQKRIRTTRRCRENKNLMQCIPMHGCPLNKKLYFIHQAAFGQKRSSHSTGLPLKNLAPWGLRQQPLREVAEVSEASLRALT